MAAANDDGALPFTGVVLLPLVIFAVVVVGVGTVLIAATAGAPAHDAPWVASGPQVPEMS